MGDLLHDRRYRNQHTQLHRCAGRRLCRQHDVPSTRRRLHRWASPREHLVHPGVLPRRAVYVVRAARSPVRTVGEERRRHHLHGDAHARGRHPPFRHSARHLRRHPGAGDVDGTDSRRRDDRLHGPRRRVRRHLDRCRPDVHLRRRRAPRVLRPAAVDSRRVGGGPRDSRHTLHGLRLQHRPDDGLHLLGRPARRGRAHAGNPWHRSVPRTALALSPIRQGCIHRTGAERLHRLRAVCAVPRHRRDALRLLSTDAAAPSAEPQRRSPPALRDHVVAAWDLGVHRSCDRRRCTVAVDQLAGGDHGERFLPEVRATGRG